MTKPFGHTRFITKSFSLFALAAFAGSICVDGKN
jgi:hypothetical protein